LGLFYLGKEDLEMKIFNVTLRTTKSSNTYMDILAETEKEAEELAKAIAETGDYDNGNILDGSLDTDDWTYQTKVKCITQES
jgi:uncharacterized alpha/beta hydrolase family protein